jgi:hypothetical protein
MEFLWNFGFLIRYTPSARDSVGYCLDVLSGLVALLLVFSSFMSVYDLGPVCLFVYLLSYCYIYLMGLIMDICHSDH